MSKSSKDSLGQNVESKIQITLSNVFKHDHFKSKTQEQAVHAVLKGKQDVFVSMPTGSGKSLCFQLPAVVNDKVTVVFSPLLALMKDQLDYLKEMKIVAKTINSKITAAERQEVLLDLRSVNPATRLLYVTPEQAKTETFKDLVQRLYKGDKLASFVVDEAHCVSQWGHDFRPDYLKLGRLRKLCPRVQWVAVTATASKTVQKDIYDQLKLKIPVAAFKVSCFRSNLFYDVVFIDTMDAGDPLNDLIEFMQCGAITDGVEVYGMEYDCGIVYCRTRAQTEELVGRLFSKGVPAMAYHGGLKDKERVSAQDDWMQEKSKIIVATVSFGMGVDKSNVRFVAHWGLPQSVAGYYQESGRAGRDGNPSRCRIYYSKKEKDAVTYLLQKSVNTAKTESKKAQAKAAITSFQCMIKYSEDTKCRHSVFTDYFGDETPECIDRCDCCVNQKAVQKKIDQFQITSVRSRTSIRSAKYDDDSDLYGGGRGGQQRETEEYSSTGERSNEKTAKFVSSSLIQKQFALRKSSQNNYDSQDSEEVVNSKVKSANTTARKVNGLTVKLRESYLGLVEECLKKNWEVCQNTGEPKGIINGVEILKCAVEVEYDAFCTNKVASLYKRLLMKIVGDVRKNTETFYLDPRLKWWNNGKLYDGVKAHAQKDPPFSLPKPPEKTTSDDPVDIKLASQPAAPVTIAPPSQNDYISASKLLPKKEPNLPPIIPAKDVWKQPPPAQKNEDPRKAPQKIDKQQTSITNFFKKPAVKQEIKKEEKESPVKVSSRRSASKPAAAKIYDLKPVVKKEVGADVEVIEVPLSRDPRKKSIELKTKENTAVNRANGKRKSARSDSSGSKRQKTSSSAAKEKPTCKSSSSCKGESKSAVAEKIIKLLNPHYKTGKIKSKEAFKKIARTLAHHISENNITDDDFMEISVTSYLEQRKVFKSEDDVFDL